jgi:ArsR family transcriptional regulator
LGTTILDNIRFNEYSIDGIFDSAYIKFMKQTETFLMLNDETRLRALALMGLEGELCVCELVYALDLSQPKISRHMAALRDAGLVVSSRRAQWVFYGINLGLPDWQKQVLDGALSGIVDESIVKKDAARLNKMKNRPERVAA